MVSAKYSEQENLVAPEELYEHAALAVIRDGVAGVSGIPNWLPSRVRKEPTQIYDINGELLFLDYHVGRGNETSGYVRTAASAVLGAPVVALELGARSWDFDAAVKKLTPRVKKESPNAKLSPAKLVCYSYPKLGVQFEIETAAERTRVIYDVADLARIPERPERPNIEGSYAWSFYESLSEQERRARLKRFARADEARKALPARVRADLVTARSLQTVATNFKFEFRSTVTKLLQYCSHYAYTHARGHHCFSLHGQQVNDYCAVATCQMILCYYRYYYTQDQIAPACGYGPGGCPPDQSPGYESLSCNHIDATFDNSPTWAEARTQIDGLHPFKSGVTGHARACAGYSRTVWIVAGTTDEKLYIYDPWPWNADFAVAGAVYWEDWGSINHTNYVFTRLTCP